MEKLKILLWLAVFLIFISFASLGRHGTNPSSRFMLTKFLVLDQQLNINESDAKFYSGMDYALKDGKYYCDKPPGISFITAPIYLIGDLFYKAGLILPQADTFNYAGDANAFFLIIIFITAINAVAAVRVYDIAKIFGMGERDSLILALVFALATLFWPYATNLFSHSLVATLLVLASYHLLKINKKRESDKANLFLTGLYLGIAITIEYVIILLLPLFAIYIIFKKIELRDKILFLVPILIASALLAIYNWLAFGSPINISYEFSTFKDTQSFDHPIWDGMYQLLFSTWRGLFFYNPILILAIPGAFMLFKKFRSEAILFIAIIASYTIFFSSYSYFTGGMCFGPRHLVSTIPFFIMLSIPMLNENFYKKFEHKKKIIYLSLVIILISISFFYMFLGSYVNLTPYPEINKNPIYEIVLPQFLEGRTESFLASSSPLLFLLLTAASVALMSYIGKDIVKN